MKKCSCCEIEKPFEEFHKNRLLSDGYQYSCKLCCKEKYYTARAEEIKRNRTNRYVENKDIIKQYYIENQEKIKDYYEANKETKREYQRRYNANNKPKRSAYQAKRRALKLNATPKWLTKEDKAFIQLLYEVCSWMKEVFEEEFHVDHIVPLKGENVCGLHIPCNLQVILARENLVKSNKLIEN